MIGLAVLLIAQVSAAPAKPPAPSPAPAAGRAATQGAPDSRESQAASEALSRARSEFEYGNWEKAARQLGALLEAGRFESVAARADAYRLLGLAHYYQEHRGEAYRAFLEYLFLEPDATLDPFYYSPSAVAFFERVKKEAEPQLAPLRAQKRAELEQRRRAAAEEAERRRQRELDEERRRLLQLQPTVERRVVQREFWVSLLPFGVGQFQNGDRSLGIALATSQVVTGAVSMGSALLIEELRDDATKRFDDRHGRNYAIAQRLNVAKWVSGALFYALWATGAVHAAIHYQPEQQLPDRLLNPPAGTGPQPGPAAQ